MFYFFLSCGERGAIWEEGYYAVRRSSGIDARDSLDELTRGVETISVVAGKAL